MQPNPNMGEQLTETSQRDIASAFSRSAPPYEEWVLRRANNVGMKTVKLVIVQADGTEKEVDLSAGDMAISANQGVYSVGKQDLVLAADALAKSVKEDPISHNAAKIIVSRLIKAGRPIPESLREWASDLLEGKLKQPKARGKLPGASEARDRIIYNLLKEVRAFGMKATSSNRENGGSACHAVAQAFQLLGLQPDSYSSIEKIWLKRRKLKGFDSRWD